MIGCDVQPLQIDVRSSPQMVRLGENVFGVNASGPVVVTVRWAGSVWSGYVYPGNKYFLFVFEDGRTMLTRAGATIYPSCRVFEEARGIVEAVGKVVKTGGQEQLLVNITSRDAFSTEILGEKLTIIPGPCIRISTGRTVKLLTYNEETGCTESYGTEFEVCGSGYTELLFIDPSTGKLIFGPVKVLHTPPTPPILPENIALALVGLLVAFLIRRDISEAVIGGAIFLIVLPLIAPLFGLSPSWTVVVVTIGWLILIILTKYGVG